MNKIFTPIQTFVIAFLGGPLGAMYTLYTNNKVLGKTEQQKLVIVVGLIAAFLVTSYLTIATNWDSDETSITINDIIFLIAYLIIICGGAERYVHIKQITKSEIKESETYQFQSIWKVLLISAIFYVITAATGLGLAVLYDSLNIIHINWEE